MHDSENGTHPAAAAETLLLTNNLVYSEPSTYFDVIDLNHHDHHHLGRSEHSGHYNEDHYSHHHLGNVTSSNISSNNFILHQTQNTSSEDATSLSHELRPLERHAPTDQLITHPYSQGSPINEEPTTPIGAHPLQSSSETNFVDFIMIDGIEHQSLSDHDGTKLNDHHNPPSDTTNTLELDAKSAIETPTADICNTDAKVSLELNISSLLPPCPLPHDKENQLYHVESCENSRPSIDCPPLTSIDDHTPVKYIINNFVDEDSDDDNDDEDDAEGDDDEDDDEDDDDEEEEEEEEEEDDSEDDSEVVDPGQHCQLIQETCTDVNEDLADLDETGLTITDVLDGERMLEVTRKLVRNTERDPDRDLRKQVLLKTAIKKLPHFMEYNRYSESLNRSFHRNISPQIYYEHHDPQQKFYHSVQPNAIQMSTTSLRMLDLNDDPEISSIEQDHPVSGLTYSSRTDLDQHDYVGQHQYDRYHQRAHDLNHYETNGPVISRHNSMDNLYQPINGSDLSEDMKDERIPIAFQIACEIYDFTCAPDDNERKLLDNLTGGYYTRPTKEPRDTGAENYSGEDCTETVDQDCSDTSSSSHSSSSDESANSLTSQSAESGVALFSSRSNKRSSSSIGLDDEMEVELSTRSPSIKFKKLRRREPID